MENQIPDHVRAVLDTLERHGFLACCVGGCVRDLLRGAVPVDWDVACAAPPEQVMALFPGHAIPTGLRHGTVTVRSDHKNVEVTTFRRDGTYADHRHPDSVTFTDALEEDLARRDFTVNAMALDLRGTITDPYGGRADLEAGVLRCVGAPRARFEEDALRILRGLRFASVLGLAVEPDTAAAIHGCRALLETIAAERIREELTKLLCGAHMEEVLREYADVIGVFLPEILPMVGFDQKNRHHCFDVWEHTLHAMAAAAPTPVLRYTLLFHDIGKPACFAQDDKGSGHFFGHPKASRALTDQAMLRLRFDNATREQVVTLVEWHDRDIQRTEKGIRRALNRLGEETLRLLLQVKRADNLAQHPDYWGRQREIDKAEAILEELLARDCCFSLKQLAVDGRDLMALGCTGPEIGKYLQRLLEQVLDGERPNERVELLEQVRQWKENK